MSSLSRKQATDGGGRPGIIRRKNKRAIVKGFVGDIAAGNFVFAGIIEDISSGGIKISHLPSDFSVEKHNYRTVVSGDGKHYRVLVIPCWSKKNELTQTIEAGFKIVEAPWEWEEFVLDASSNPGLGGERGYHHA